MKSGPKKAIIVGHYIIRRSKAAYQAHVEWGYPLKDIGDILGVHYSTVSRMVRREEAGMWRCKTPYLLTGAHPETLLAGWRGQ